MRFPLTQEEFCSRLNKLEQQVELGVATKAELRELRKRLFEELEGLQTALADIRGKGTPVMLGRLVARHVVDLQNIELRVARLERF